MVKKDSHILLEEVGEKHLSQLLSENGGKLDSEKLWQLSMLKIDDFMWFFLIF